MISSKSFYEQVVKYTEVNGRREFLSGLCAHKTTLHIGCADWPVFHPQSNLHIYLYQGNNMVEGFDPDIETIQKMKDLPELQGAALYTSLPNKTYEVLLIPETIEHVGNAQDFLTGLIPLTTNSTQIIVTAPNAFCDTWIKGNVDSGTEFQEGVHPDHKCWYSLYTLPNLILSAYKGKRKVELLDIGVLDNKTMVYVIYTLSN